MYWTDDFSDRYLVIGMTLPENLPKSKLLISLGNELTFLVKNTSTRDVQSAVKEVINSSVHLADEPLKKVSDISSKMQVKLSNINEEISTLHKKFGDLGSQIVAMKNRLMSIQQKNNQHIREAEDFAKLVKRAWFCLVFGFGMKKIDLIWHPNVGDPAGSEEEMFSFYPHIITIKLGDVYPLAPPIPNPACTPSGDCRVQ